MIRFLDDDFFAKKKWDWRICLVMILNDWMNGMILRLLVMFLLLVGPVGIVLLRGMEMHVAWEFEAEKMEYPIIHSMMGWEDASDYNSVMTMNDISCVFLIGMEHGGTETSERGSYVIPGLFRIQISPFDEWKSVVCSAPEPDQ